MDPKLQAFLKTVVGSYGSNLTEALMARVNPDELLKQAQETMAAQMKEAIVEVLYDPESPLKGVVENLTDQLDSDKLIDVVATIAAPMVAEWLKTEGQEALVAAIARKVTDQLDIEAIGEEVVSHIVNKLNTAKI